MCCTTYTHSYVYYIPSNLNLQKIIQNVGYSVFIHDIFIDNVFFQKAQQQRTEHLEILLQFLHLLLRDHGSFILHLAILPASTKGREKFKVSKCFQRQIENYLLHSLEINELYKSKLIAGQHTLPANVWVFSTI